MNKMSEDEAIDILQNCIADYVIGEYCEKCDDRLVCVDKNEDCYFQQAIEKVLNELETYKHYYEELTTGQVTSAQLLKKYVSRDELEALNEGWKIECEKKDKIINAMATTISGISEIRAIMGISNVIASQDEIIKRYERNVVDE